jgi:Tfp pilus assembly protein PilF
MSIDLNAAIDALDAGDPARCVSLSRSATIRTPSNARAWQLLALGSRELQDSATALSAFERAAKLAPNDAKIAAGLATSAYEAGRPSAVLFHRACQILPNDSELLLSTVAALRADGHPQVGEQLLVRALDANPAWVRGYDALATIRWTAGETGDFTRGFGQGCAMNPDDLSLRIAWARAFSQARQWDNAHAVIDDGRRIFGHDGQFDALEAFIASESGDDDRAERWFSNPTVLNNPSMRIAHIRHCLRTERVAQADAIVATLSQMPETAAAAWPYLSLIWRLKNDPRAAWLDGDPPFIRVFDLSLLPDTLNDLAAYLRALHTTRQHPAAQSLRGGTQTEGDLLQRIDAPIAGLRAAILNAVRTYVDDLPAHDAGHPLLGTPRGQLLFAGSWSVRLVDQGFHIVHTHTRGWISSALYIALPTEMGTAPAGWLELGAPPPDLRIELPPYMRVEPKPGRLVLFPSTMWHGTVPFASGERLTVAFDVARPPR